ncbi:MAG: ethanolamine ammonia-lyase reactivating factor EutA [Candidatus Thorarchaeota archaeon]
MTEVDANRLKWRIIEIVNDFLKEHFSEDATNLEEQFTRQYELLLEQYEDNDTLETSRIQHLIKEFKPALGSVLQDKELFDRLVRMVSPVLNASLSRAEGQRIQTESSSQITPSRRAEPKTRYIPLHDSATSLKLLSVGIDIGSSTSHLVFSRLTLGRERSFLNPTNRFQLIDREIIYEGTIIFTPLLDRYTIDIEAIVEFCKDEYKKAGITPDMVDTGAVLVTGETAKKQNAAEIVKRLSSESGKFVSAAAGPNFESLLGAMGSGIVEYSRENQRTVLHVDIGGGTSNIAIASNGQVISTSCINVGGRLLGIDEDLKIWRIDGPTQFVMKELGMDYKIGDIIPEEDARSIAREYAKALVEVMTGPAKSTIAKELMMTDDLDSSIVIDEYSLSGGVAELFYGSEERYDDIGKYLAEELHVFMSDLDLSIVEPEHKIRATVIGAGSFTLSVSGSSCYSDKSLEYPIENIPVIPVNVIKENFTPERLVEEVARSLGHFDMEEGVDLVGLYFKDPFYQSSSLLQQFVAAIEEALPNSVVNEKLIILLFGSDIGQMVGLTLKRETAIQDNLICLDELELEAGDWIDIGAPLHSGQAFPVTVKSLVFNQDKTYS